MPFGEHVSLIPEVRHRKQQPPYWSGHSSSSFSNEMSAKIHQTNLQFDHKVTLRIPIITRRDQLVCVNAPLQTM